MSNPVIVVIIATAIAVYVMVSRRQAQDAVERARRKVKGAEQQIADLQRQIDRNGPRAQAQRRKVAHAQRLARQSRRRAEAAMKQTRRPGQDPRRAAARQKRAKEALAVSAARQQQYTAAQQKSSTDRQNKATLDRRLTTAKRRLVKTQQKLTALENRAIAQRGPGTTWRPRKGERRPGTKQRGSR
jgi:DNA repair exonuclease SbcCD ATPase subunit